MLCCAVLPAPCAHAARAPRPVTKLRIPYLHWTDCGPSGSHEYNTRQRRPNDSRFFVSFLLLLLLFVFCLCFFLFFWAHTLTRLPPCPRVSAFVSAQTLSHVYWLLPPPAPPSLSPASSFPGGHRSKAHTRDNASPRLQRPPAPPSPGLLLLKLRHDRTCSYSHGHLLRPRHPTLHLPLFSNLLLKGCVIPRLISMQLLHGDVRR